MKTFFVYIKLYTQKYLFRTLDIGSPLCKELSNFQPYEFTFRGIKFYSMEGLLQGIKFNDLEKQKSVFKLIGKKAKFKGKKSKWYIEQTLYFQGEAIKRDSQEYKDFIEDAFLALYIKNPTAQRNLLNTSKYKLIHSIGKNDITKTVLTEKEFCDILLKIRNCLNQR